MGADALATAVIAAAGSGDRLGAGGPKALAEVAGKPLLAWSLAALEAAETIGDIVVAAPPGYENEIRALSGSATLVEGGSSRSESVANALEAVESELVVVHDAARPLAPRRRCSMQSSQSSRATTSATPSSPRHRSPTR